MSANQESLDIKKAMAYDLLSILKAEEDRKYSAEEIEKIIRAYIAGLSQE